MDLMLSTKRRRLMERLLWHSGATIIMYAVALHVSWAILILRTADAAIHTTPLHALAEHFGSDGLLATVFMAAAICTTLGAFAPQRVLGLALMLPQQTVLMLAAWGAMVAVLAGAYPDGTVRWWPFILSDQLPLILLAPSYTVGILAFHNVFRWRT